MNGNQEFYSNHDLTKTNFPLRWDPLFLPFGFTLLEVMIALAILSLLMFALQSPVEHFHRIVFNQQIESDVSMSVQRAQLLLKSELVQAGYGMLSSDQEGAFEIRDGILSFKADLNLDGALNHSREKIAYRFDAERQMLLRKSGRGNYQRFVAGLHYLRFEYWTPSANDSTALCLKITTQVLEQQGMRETVLCPFSF